MAERPGVLFYFDLLPALEKLKAEDAGALFLGAMHYARDGKEPMFHNTSLDFAWEFIRPAIDRDGAAYQEKKDRGAWLTYCRECKRAGGNPDSFEQWRQRTDNDTLSPDNVPSPTTYTSITTDTTQPKTESDSDIGIRADKPPKPTRFTPPSVDEVRAYCQERKNQVDPERFVAFYESKGWMIGKNKMKDWKAAILTWERGDGNGKASSPAVSAGESKKRWNIKSVQLD